MRENNFPIFAVFFTNREKKEKITRTQSDDDDDDVALFVCRFVGFLAVLIIYLYYYAHCTNTIRHGSNLMLVLPSYMIKFLFLLSLLALYTL